MKAVWVTGIVVLAVVGLVVLLHWTRVLPLPPAPPFYDGGQKVWITPTNPWTWFK